MTVDLLPAPTDEQAMLLDASVRFMDAEHPMATVRQRADGGTYDDDAYRRAAAELGWFGLLADEAHGGGSISGNGVLDAAVIAAERGARLQPGPFPGHSAVVHALSDAGVREDVLTELIAGASWATWAAGSESACTLEGARLRGAIRVLADGPACRWLLVGAQAVDGPALVLVRADAPGVHRESLTGLDVTRRWSAVELVDLAISADDVIGAPGAESEARRNRLAERAAVLSAAESLGAMHADFELALQYAKDRVAFGRPIGSFQAIKHLLADTSLWLEMSKGIVAAAATALGTGAADGAELAHAAKSFVAERGVELAHNCFQVFGGIGYTWEHDQHLYFRRLASDAEAFGSAREQRSRLLDVVGVGR
jgi:alkylation response protein AidB-like acyl-CoA dehydrogenase